MGDIIPWAACHIPGERGVRLPATSSAVCAAATRPHSLEASPRQFGYSSSEKKGSRDLQTHHVHPDQEITCSEANPSLLRSESKEEKKYPAPSLPAPIGEAVETKVHSCIPSSWFHLRGQKGRRDRFPLMKSLYKVPLQAVKAKQKDPGMVA